MKKLLGALVVTGGALFAISSQADASVLEDLKKDKIIIEEGDFGSILEPGDVIVPFDTIVKGNTETKTVQSMYGEITMEVTYDRNITTKKSTITGIKSLKNTDGYLTLHDKYFSAGQATAVYYNKYDKVYVTITITSAECDWFFRYIKEAVNKI